MAIFVEIVLGFLVGGGIGVDLLGGDDEAVQAGADGRAGHEREDRALVGAKDGDLVGADRLDIGNLVEIIDIFVLELDFVAFDKLVQKGEDLIVAALGPRIIRAMAGNEDIADFAGKSGLVELNETIGETSGDSLGRIGDAPSDGSFDPNS